MRADRLEQRVICRRTGREGELVIRRSLSRAKSGGLSGRRERAIASAGAALADISNTDDVRFDAGIADHREHIPRGSQAGLW